MEKTQPIFLKADGTNKREKLVRKTEKGELERIERGVYRRSDGEISEYESLLTAGLIVPKGVICLLSALRFHDITTQNPFEVWMAIAPHAHRPKANTVRLKLVHFSGESLTEGIEEIETEGQILRVYSVAKTIADCFKFRNKIGLDTAIEALKESRRKKLFTPDELWHYAKICRVSKVMRPYLEAL